MNQYNVSSTTMGQTPPKGLVMAKKSIAPKTHVIWGGMWPYRYENKVGTIEGIHLLNLQGENSPKNVQK